MDYKKIDDAILKFVPKPILTGLAALLIVTALSNLAVTVPTNYRLKFKGETPAQIEESWKEIHPLIRNATYPGRFFEYSFHQLEASLEDELVKRI